MTAEENVTEHDVSRYINPRFRWYIVNTYSGFEDSVKLSLLERIGRSKLEAEFGEILIPKMSVERVLKSGKRKLITKTSFPGYILVQMHMTEQTMACVTSTQKVTGFVGNRRDPRPMADEEVFRLMNPSAGQPGETSVKVSFEKGEMIKVVDGPFTNFDGVIEEVRPDKMKLKVLVSIFGRETPVELAYAQVQKLS